MIAARNALLMSGAGPTPPPLPYDAEVEYLQTPNMTYAEQYTAHIDTGIVPTLDTEVTIDCTLINTSAGDQICATRTGAVNINRYFVLSVSATRNRSVLGNTTISNVATVGTRHSILFNEAGTHDLYVDGARIGNLGTAYQVASNLSLYLFATNGYAPSYGASNSRIYKCEIRQGGALVRGFQPVRVGTGANAVGYLYDRVSGALFGNAGSGALVVGPDK